MSFHVQSESAGITSMLNLAFPRDRYIAMLGMMGKSATLFDDQASLVLLTDEKSPLWGLHRGFRKYRYRVRREAIMLDRMAAQVAYLRAEGIPEPVLLLDSDILLNAPLSDIFEQDFDVALTWRKSADMPINGGLIILNNRRPDVGLRFMEEVYDIYCRQFSDEANWFGDQRALRQWLEVGYRDMEREPLVDINGVRVLFLPCEQYNHSPDNHAGSFLQRDDTVAVMHFKGERKQFMAPYWHAHLAGHGAPDWLTRWRAGRARQWLAEAAGREGAVGTLSERVVEE